MRSLHGFSIVLAVVCTVFCVSAAAGQQYLCDQGSGKFAARTQEGVEVTVGPEREGGLAKRVCDASINWGKDRLVVAANAATADLDMLGATLGKMGPVAAFQVRSNPNDFMSYVIYSLREPPHVLRRLSGASTFSAADTDLDGRGRSGRMMPPPWMASTGFSPASSIFCPRRCCVSNRADCWTSARSFSLTTTM